MFPSIARSGLDGIAVAPEGAPAERAAIFEGARAAGLSALALVDPISFTLDDPLVSAHPSAFVVQRDTRQDGPIDPRRPAPAQGVARLRLDAEGFTETVLATVVARLEAVVKEGADGVVLAHMERATPRVLGTLIAALPRARPGGCVAVSVTPEASGAMARLLSGMAGKLDLALIAVDEDAMSSGAAFAAFEALRPFVRPVFDLAAVSSPALQTLAAAMGGFVLAQDAMGPSSADLAALAHDAETVSGALIATPQDEGAPLTVLRTDSADLRLARRVHLVIANLADSPLPAPSPAALPAAAGLGLSAFSPLGGGAGLEAPLAPGEVRRLVASRAPAIAETRFDGAQEASTAAARPRIIIEDVTPRVDDGEFPVKRVVGEEVLVEADIFADGHEVLGARLIWRAEDEDGWQSAPLTHQVNDRWEGHFSPERMGRYRFALEAWWDRFGTLRRDLGKKRDAGVVQTVDCEEGRLLVEAARAKADPARRAVLEAALSAYNAVSDPGEKAATLLDDLLADAMQALDPRPHLVRSAEFPLDSERLAARFSSWYELFPRSQTDTAGRHGTLRDVIGRLPAIRVMGFDTLYFPPIHPIGTAHRKGRNNATTAAPGDPGSPYAIGSPEGGHDAVHPELGTLEDFVALVEAARAHGLEVALDFAIQCSPDHPWLKQHPGWFDWRPDGTIKYAENPPKKYQDIVNVDFYARDAIPSLWLALRDIVAFWISKGVTVFRVDNPHTKPFAFWEWMIADIRRVHPEAIFLAEAFTRPKVMYRLAKVGFSQSYTYFTWRNHKHELTEYLTELTTTAPKDFFRPHFFVNTPDINPTFLHQSGPAGFKIRAALAATLSGLFGVYSGFELCEAAPVPGKEEYLDSEKYELRPRDWDAPGNIIADITLLNRLRRAHPELQTHLGVTFYTAWNDNIVYFGKRAPGGRGMILVAISLDPYNAQEAGFEVPLWEFGLGDDAQIAVADLVAGRRFAWHGKHQHMRLEPDRPYRIWKLTPPGAQG